MDQKHLDFASTSPEHQKPRASLHVPSFANSTSIERVRNWPASSRVVIVDLRALLFALVSFAEVSSSGQLTNEES
jgi:hypothetical protein